MHTVRFSRSGDECDTASANHDQTLLSVAKEHGLQIPSVCQGRGTCNSCCIKVRSGLENLFHKQTDEPFADDRKVKACMACVRGDVAIETRHRIQ